jgi:putative transposase
MARHLRVEYPGAIYHITARGVERRAIFRDDADRERFLKRLETSVGDHGVRLYLWCLMSNHVHLLVETPRGNVSAFMHGLLTGYTVYHNRRHHRAGHLLQGRFGAKLVEGDRYLLRMSRYLHLNPVNTKPSKGLPVAERGRILRKYRWSSYRSYIGLVQPPAVLDAAPLFRLVCPQGGDVQQAYRRYAEAGLAKTDEEWLEILRESPRSIGSEAFRREVDKRHEERVREGLKSEDVALRRRSDPRKVAEVLQAVAAEVGVEVKDLAWRRRDGWVRRLAAWMMCRHAGMTQREAAARLGLRTGAAVSLAIKKLREETEQNPAMRKMLERLEQRLC